MTNNTSVSLAKYYKKINDLGLPIQERGVISPTITLTNWLVENNYKSFYSVGTADFNKEVSTLSNVKYDDKKPEIVVVAFDLELTYLKLKKACEFINKGIPWVITHVDLACPSKGGPIPDCGSIAKLISHTTGKEPLLDFGKPSDLMCDLIKTISNDSKDILVSGDRVYTDAKIGIKLGATTVLVCTGEYELGQDLFVDVSGEVKISESLSYFLDEKLRNT